MNAQSACPEQSVLQSLLHGQLSAAEAEALEGHLLACPTCVQTIKALQLHDTLIAALRQPPQAAEPSERDTVQQLILSLKQLGQEHPHVVATGSPGDSGRATAAHRHEGASQTPELPADVYDFLAPAQGPDELGRLGPFRILRVIGAGGMGVVFEAEDPQLKRSVALKVMKPALAASDSARRRFLREAQTTAAIEHDHIVPIYQVGEDRGIPYLAMPLLRGESLETRLGRQRKLALPESLRIGRQIAEGLAAAHEHGLIHRDIKPANIWLEGNQERVRILDFGLARGTGDTVPITQSGVVVGTPAYMAPEQTRGEPVDARSDLFSFGCVLYRLCTGRLPFQAKDVTSMLLALATQEPPSPRRLDPAIPAALSDLVMSLLAKDPGRRPPTSRGVVAALAAIERDPGVALPAPPLAETTELPPAIRPPVRGSRRRIASLALAIGVAAVVVLAAGILIRVSTPKGQLVIETDDPAVEVVVKQGGATIIDRTSKREIALKVGEYEIGLADAKEGLTLSSDHFSITRDGRTTVKVSLERNNVAAERGRGVTPAALALRALEARAKDPAAARDQLRSDLLAFGRRFPGTPQAVQVAGLL